MEDIIIENLIAIITGIFLALLGIIVQKTRAYNLIAGYNTSSPEEKRKVNIEKVAIALRNSFILLGFMWVFIPILSDLIGLGMIKWLFVIVFHFAITIMLLINVNKRDKYKMTENEK